MPTFKIIKTSTKTNARAGILKTRHGEIRTPCFMPVGTQGTVKCLTPKMVDELGADIILGNTYHLSLRPGIDLIRDFGGLHDFIGWKKPILTDSGGYQVFSLAKMRKITPEGVTFQSHINGEKCHFTPRSVVDLQLGFNSDILMPLDICTPYPASEKQTDDELEITFKWEKEAADHWKAHHSGQHLFGIIQGGMYPELRQKSAEQIISLDLPGYALGGLSVGEPKDMMMDLVESSTTLLPENKPRYLMGVGLPEDIEFAIHQGIDMFDCVAPTRLARHGHVFTEDGKLNIRNEKFKADKSSIDPNCSCYTCQQFSRAYIRHLFIANEITALTLMTLHNIHFLIQITAKIRESILQDN